MQESKIGISKKEQQLFKVEIFKVNIYRIRVSCLIIGIMVIFIMLFFLFFSDILPITQQSINSHIVLYVCIVLYLAVIYFFTANWEQDISTKNIKKRNIYITIHLNFLLAWSVLMAFFSGREHLSINVYIIVALTVSQLFYNQAKKMLLIYLPSHIFFIIWLLFIYETNGEIIIDGIVNSSFFIILGLTICELNYRTKIKEYLIEKKLAEKNRELKKHSENDYLTGLYNRRKFKEIVSDEMQRSSRSGAHVSLLFIDIDNFKEYNDYYGHIQGDECLKQIALIIKNVARRKTDNHGRFGGDEFTVVLPYTNYQAGMLIAEKIRKNVEDAKIINEKSKLGIVTVSIGVAHTVNKEGKDCDWFYHIADNALYKAKHSQRNCVR